MTDLDAAIRAKLASWGDDPCGYATCVVVGWSEMRAAIVAVLDRHKPAHVDHPLNPNLANCSTCRDLGPEINSPAAYPCEEIEDIAKALGIEAS